jgi:two-component system cell cycle response regulator DivK
MTEGAVLDGTQRGPTILLAEDDIAQLSLYTRILIGTGYYVIGVDNGDDAVAMTRRELPGLVIMDATLPGKDGWTATRELKADVLTRHIPIILATGLTGDADERAAAVAGCDVFLRKPIPVRDLLAAVFRFLAPRPDATPIHATPTSWPS